MGTADSHNSSPLDSNLPYYVPAAQMGRKFKSSNKTSYLESFTPPILEVGFSDPLFSCAAHPTRPIVVSGLGTGHVFCHSYDPDALEESLLTKRDRFLSSEKSREAQPSLLKDKWWKFEADHAKIASDQSLTVSWKTKRHKGSCRSVLFDMLENSAGESVFTVGTDNMLKKAKTESGKVQSKVDISRFLQNETDSITTMSMANTHPFLVTGTEDGNLLVFDSNDLSGGKVKFTLSDVHEDAINKILAMPAISPYHFLALGSTKLAHVDIRKGIITQSDDQADELLSMCYPTEFVNGNKNDTAVVSHGEGVLTLWKNSVNGFSDQISRVKVNRNASIDAIISTMNSGDDMINSVWCGDSDGYLHRVDYKKGKTVETRVHSSLMSKSGAVDEVGGLDIDFDYRLISSGMEGLKIWSGQTFEGCEDSEFDEESDDNSSSDDVDMSGFGSDSTSTSSDDEDGDEDGEEDGDADEDEDEYEDQRGSQADSNSSDGVVSVSKKNDLDGYHAPGDRKRGNVFHDSQKAKKEKIDKKGIASKTNGNRERLAENRSKEASSKNGLLNHGISRFDDL